MSDLECAIYATIFMASVGLFAASRRWDYGFGLIVCFICWVLAFFLLEAWLGVGP